MMVRMKCPNCSVEAPAGAAECASCGLVFAKLRKKIEELEAPRPAAYNPWIGRAIAAAVVALWILGFGLYYRRAVAKARASRPPAARPAP
jgi:hypothetical protein